MVTACRPSNKHNVEMSKYNTRVCQLEFKTRGGRSRTNALAMGLFDDWGESGGEEDEDIMASQNSACSATSAASKTSTKSFKDNRSCAFACMFAGRPSNKHNVECV